VPEYVDLGARGVASLALQVRDKPHHVVDQVGDVVAANAGGLGRVIEPALIGHPQLQVTLAQQRVHHPAPEPAALGVPVKQHHRLRRRGWSSDGDAEGDAVLHLHHAVVDGRRGRRQRSGAVRSEGSGRKQPHRAGGAERRHLVELVKMPDA
jgi:hypothetical protein